MSPCAGDKGASGAALWKEAPTESAEGGQSGDSASCAVSGLLGNFLVKHCMHA